MKVECVPISSSVKLSLQLIRGRMQLSAHSTMTLMRRILPSASACAGGLLLSYYRHKRYITRGCKSGWVSMYPLLVMAKA